jgi:hypothetical protein
VTLFYGGGNKMRFSIVALTVAALLAAPGCSTLVSLQPFATGNEPDPGLAGLWRGSGDDDTWVVQQDGGGYSIVVVGKSETTRLKASLLRVGEAMILDVAGDEDNPFELPAHAPIRVWTEGTTLRVATLDTDWIKQQAARELPSQKVGEQTVLTATGEAVRSFWQKYGADDKACSKPDTFQRIK